MAFFVLLPLPHGGMALPGLPLLSVRLLHVMRVIPVCGRTIGNPRRADVCRRLQVLARHGQVVPGASVWSPLPERVGHARVVWPGAPDCSATPGHAGLPRFFSKGVGLRTSFRARWTSKIFSPRASVCGPLPGHAGRPRFFLQGRGSAALCQGTLGVQDFFCKGVGLRPSARARWASKIISARAWVCGPLPGHAGRARFVSQGAGLQPSARARWACKIFSQGRCSAALFQASLDM